MFYQLLAYTGCYKVSKNLRGSVPTKTSKKSNENGSEDAYFLGSAHLFIVAKNKSAMGGSPGDVSEVPLT